MNMVGCEDSAKRGDIFSRACVLTGACPAVRQSKSWLAVKILPAGGGFEKMCNQINMFTIICQKSSGSVSVISNCASIMSENSSSSRLMINCFIKQITTIVYQKPNWYYVFLIIFSLNSVKVLGEGSSL
jgi:hypothetical protein